MKFVKMLQKLSRRAYSRAYKGAALALVISVGNGALSLPARAADGAAQVAQQAVAPPDYDDPAMWAAGPGGAGPAGALPQGSSPAARDPKVDVFYVHPTTFRSKEGKWNQDPRDAVANKWTDESVIQRQASAFTGCCAVWAPRYRAASSNALGSAEHRDAAYALGYSDVERAFDWFLEHVSKGRPFIIAGHSQGGKHVGDLLEKRIEGTALEGRMVAAYIIGINLAEGDFGLRFKSTPVCAKPDQTGCAIQWNAVLAGADLAPLVAAYEKSFTDVHGDVAGSRPLCINPVTFDRDRPAAISSQALGAVPGEPGFGPMQPLRKGAVAVRCEQGLAVVYPAPGLGLKPLPGGVMHYHDVGLFWADLRANAQLRTQSWLEAHSAGVN